MNKHTWMRDELLATFNLYCRTPFGRLHKGNPDVIQLASKIGRSPSAVAMKLVNFASLDPVQQARNIKGLSNASRADEELWQEFNVNPEKVAFESQQAFDEVMFIDSRQDIPEEDYKIPEGPTETLSLTRTRLVQRFFRETVLASYNYKCAICSLGIAELLTASHIIPWSKEIKTRADPRNGLALCVSHDRAFDRGLLSLDEFLKVIIASSLKEDTSSNIILQIALKDIEGQTISLPMRFAPDPSAIAYHRQTIFRH